MEAMFWSRTQSGKSAKSARSVHSFVAVTALFSSLFFVSPASAAPSDSDASEATRASSFLLEPYSQRNAVVGTSSHVSKVATNESFEGLMELAELSPTLIKPDSDVRVSVKVTNTSDQKITDPQVTFNLTRVRFSTRLGLDSWESRVLGDAPGDILASETLNQSLAPGKTANFQFTIKASQFALLGGYEGWGPRGVTLEFFGKQDGGKALIDALNTYVIWYPDAQSVTENLNVSTIVPLTGATLDPLADQETNQVLGTEVLAQVANTQPLAKALEAVKGVPSVSLAVDPELLESIDAAATPQPAPEGLDAVTASPTAEDSPNTEPDADPALEETFEQQEGRSWIDAFLNASTSHELLALPDYDSDWAPFADANVEMRANPTLSSQNLQSVEFSDAIAWPSADSFSAPVLQKVSDSNYPIALAEADVLLDNDQINYTPSATLKADIAPNTTVFNADERLTFLVQTPKSDNPVVERQRLIAELAVISKERPAENRNLVIAPNRSWSPEPSVANAQLSALESLPWVSTQPMSALADQDLKAQTDVPLAKAPSGPNLFEAGEFSQLREVQRSLNKFSRVVLEPKRLTDPYANSLARLTSQNWLTDLSGQDRATEGYKASATATMQTITVAPSSDINMISTGAEIPLTVRNDLDQDVTLQVQLSPNDPRLQADAAVPITIPANSSDSLRVPVTAVGSGNVAVKVNILDESGSLITSTGSFDVRVRADWENMGTAVVFSLLAILLVGGVWRTIRRGRSENRSQALDTQEALALVEAEAEERK